jgi:hypothetical protein
MGGMVDHIRKLQLDPKHILVPPVEIALRGVTEYEILNLKP